MANKVKVATPEEKLELASLANLGTFTYQDRDGQVFTTWESFVWSQLRRKQRRAA